MEAKAQMERNYSSATATTTSSSNCSHFFLSVKFLIHKIFKETTQKKAKKYKNVCRKY